MQRSHQTGSLDRMDELADQQTQDAWLGILSAHAKVVRALEADLATDADLPITWLDVMKRLYDHPDRQIRIHELADASLLTRSGLTRLVDRIEQVGYVSREHSTTDRRGVYVVLTQTGIAKMDELWPAFIASIQRHFGQHLDPADTKALIQATSKILNQPT